MDDATIIKALNDCGNGKDTCRCCMFNEPEQEYWHPECLYRAVRIAADRLEALINENAALLARAERAEGEINKGWISVEDRLPQVGQVVQIMERIEAKLDARYEPKENEYAPWRLPVPEKELGGIFRRRKEHVTHWRLCAGNALGQQDGDEAMGGPVDEATTKEE